MLRLRRPFVVVDEAHNSRTELAFDMLARFRPSGVMELTATPDLERTPSNVLHSVSALQSSVSHLSKGTADRSIIFCACRSVVVRLARRSDETQSLRLTEITTSPYNCLVYRTTRHLSALFCLVVRNSRH
nr:hypothetical protein [Rhodoferax sp.]